jgi:hypothetical protein
MPEPELFLLFVRPLNRLGIRYVVTGSVAAIFYGEPRLTHDVDFIVLLREADIEVLAKSFSPPEFYVPPPETITAEVRREQRGHFNIIHIETGFKADMYLTGRDELNAWAFKSRRQVEFEGEPVVLAPPEYVIVRKLEYYREGGSEKHLRDIRSMLAISGDQLDRPALSEWIQQRGLQAEWRLVSKSQDEPGS